MDKDNRYWKYGLLVYIIANYVGYLGNYLKLIVYISLIVVLVVYLIKLRKSKNETLTKITIIAVIIAASDLLMNLYIEIFNSEYTSLIKSSTIPNIEKIYALILLLIIFLWAYKKLDKDRMYTILKYIILKYVKLVIIVSIIILVVFLLMYFTK